MTDRPERSLLQRDILAAGDAVVAAQARPARRSRNPVMFVVEIGAADHRRG